MSLRVTCINNKHFAKPSIQTVAHRPQAPVYSSWVWQNALETNSIPVIVYCLIPIWIYFTYILSFYSFPVKGWILGSDGALRKDLYCCLLWRGGLRILMGHPFSHLLWQAGKGHRSGKGKRKGVMGSLQILS